MTSVDLQLLLVSHYNRVLQLIMNGLMIKVVSLESILLNL